jgi:hypothetical protein
MWVCALSAALSSVPAFTQVAPLSDPCHAMPAGGAVSAKNFLTFDQFDKELRVALTKQDAVALAFLVTFPLRVNDAGGTISLNDAAALKTHFQEVFTPAVRKEILSEKNDAVGCNVEGIGYARGVIWVESSERGYAIWSVNRDAVTPFPATRPNTPRIEYVCQTQTHRIVIDSAVGGALRYRSWNRPRPVTEAPDLEIAKGVSSFEGTDLCTVPIYTFRNGTATYTIDGGLGCAGDSDGPPKGSTGRLEVSVAGNAAIGSWCY